MTIPDLLSPTDFQKFKTKDEDWFLGQAGEVIRDYCGWHIAPEISVTNVQAEIGAHGIVVLPTLNLVSVERVELDGFHLIEGYDFVAHSAGWLQLYGMGCGTTRLGRLSYVTVDMTHGFSDIPKAVAEVGFELASRTIEKPSGVVTDLTSGPYRFKFGELGSVLSDEMKARLGPYRIERV